MSIKDWPDSERPREKLLERGAASLSDAELLAIFLQTGLRGKSAVALAREIITIFGSLRALLDGDQRQLTAIPGMGVAKYVRLRAGLELGRRYLESRLQRGEAFSNPGDTKAFLSAQLKGLPYEVFACLFLDTRHRLIRFEELFRGSIDGAQVYPRIIVKRALDLNAAAVILAHNHPSGVAEPSPADAHLTTRLKDALALVEVRVLDHIVIGDDEVVSLAERGLM